jgi:DNA-binding transcriptional ArsR family regulator
MRKLTLEIEPNESMRKAMEPLFEKIHSYEILESLKIDMEECSCIDLVEFMLKDGVSIEDQSHIGNMEILSVLKSDGNEHTCLVKHHEPEESKEEFREFDLDIIYTTPMMVTKDRQVISVLGDQKDLKKIIAVIKPNAERIINMTFKRAAYQKKDVLSVLTEKQKETIIAAFDHGYYDYPKKITSEELSKKVNISKGTLMEHLRKAEGRLLKEILTGHSSK